MCKDSCEYFSANGYLVDTKIQVDGEAGCLDHCTGMIAGWSQNYLDRAFAAVKADDWVGWTTALPDEDVNCTRGCRYLDNQQTLATNWGTTETRESCMSGCHYHVKFYLANNMDSDFALGDFDWSNVPEVYG